MGKFSCCFILFVSFSVVRAVGDSKDGSGAASGASAQRKTAEELPSCMSERTSLHESTQGKARKLSGRMTRAGTGQRNGRKAVSGESAPRMTAGENSSDVRKLHSMPFPCEIAQLLARHANEFVDLINVCNRKINNVIYEGSSDAIREGSIEDILNDALVPLEPVCNIYDYAQKDHQDSARPVSWSLQDWSLQNWKLSVTMKSLPPRMEELCKVHRTTPQFNQDLLSHLVAMCKSVEATYLQSWLKKVDTLWQHCETERAVNQERPNLDELCRKQALAAFLLADYLFDSVTHLITTDTQDDTQANLRASFDRINALCRAHDNYSTEAVKKIANVSADEASLLTINIKWAEELRHLDLPESIESLCIESTKSSWESFCEEDEGNDRRDKLVRIYRVVLLYNQENLTKWANAVRELKIDEVLGFRKT